QPLVLTPEQLASNGDSPHSVCYAPLVLGNNVIGVLGVNNVSEETHIFTKHDSALLSALSDYAAIALENARNYESLNERRESENEHIRGTFKRFVPEAVVDRALDIP